MWLTGRFVSLDPGKEYPDRNGVMQRPFKLTVLVGRTTFGVEFRDLDSALDSLGGSVPAELADVTVPVFAQGPWDPEARRRGPVFFSGRRVSEGVA